MRGTVRDRGQEDGEVKAAVLVRIDEDFLIRTIELRNRGIAESLDAEGEDG